MTWIVERFNNWLAGATDQTIVGTCFVLAGVLGFVVGWEIYRRRHREEP